MRDDVKGGAHRLTPIHRTAKERKAEQKKYEGPVAAGGNDYAYGTRLDLGEDEHKKLGITGTHAVGHEVAIHARAKVLSSSVHQDDGDETPRRSMSLQITHMGIGAPQAPAVPKTLTRAPARPVAPTTAAKLRRV